MSSVVAYDLFSASAAVLDSSDALAAQLTRSAKIAMPAAVLGATLGLIAADSADKADFDEKELARAIQQAQDGCGEASRTLAELQKQRGNMQEHRQELLRELDVKAGAQRAAAEEELKAAKAEIDKECGQKVADIMQRHGLGGATERGES